MAKWRTGVAFLLLLGLSIPGVAQEIAHLGPPAKPTVVSIGFLLLDLNAINEREETFELEAILTLSWKDPRYAFDPEEAGIAQKQFQGKFQVTELYAGWWPQIIVGNGAGTATVDAEILRIDPDGSITYIEEFHVEAEQPLNLRAFPFDHQHLSLYLQVLGHDASQVQLVPDTSHSGISSELVNIAGWTITDTGIEVIEVELRPGMRISQFIGRLNVSRNPFHLIALVVFPLSLLVVLTWSVFWMDEESLSDRINISFIGVLAVVAYQFIVQEAMPAISYFTLMDAFLVSTLAIIGLSVAINLIVDKLNRADRRELGDTVDYVCRWIFPLAFISVNGFFALFLL